ncbi:glycoside hydrolase family 25 protein [Aquimarina spongiae]|uniref:Lysozyme n=1 Tax=Aquimarina spongiae TaxID=570521 RepID=A0A1M6ISZ9_9FLAO|nr:GH25 family lysozyme [Aquimarina spongiae]SHJ37479.1 lysozyme [Aquimarina spongiae]
MKKAAFFLLTLCLMISCKKEQENIEVQQPDVEKKEVIKDLCTSEEERIRTEPSILGMDISHFQGEIQWNKIKADGVNFVYMKATQGTTFKDPRFEKNHAATKKNCLYRGAYHFYETGKDPKKQAQNFTETVKELIPGDLPPVLDLEELGMQTSVTKEMYETNTLRWLKIVEEKLGVRPIIYSNPTFANAYLKHPEFANYKLWIADYTKGASPTMPYTWKDKSWTFWQRTDSKKLEGAEGKIDYDLFQGDADSFLKMIKK